MSKKAALMKIKELKTDIGIIKNLELFIGRIFEEEWEEGRIPDPTLLPRLIRKRAM